MLNRGWFRVSSKSSYFFREERTVIPRKLSTWSEVAAIKNGKRTPRNWSDVLRELYSPYASNSDASLEVARKREGLAYEVAQNNDLKRQYYLHRTKKMEPAVIHIITTGEFWENEWEEEEVDYTPPKDSNYGLAVGKRAYTNGFVWCSTYPNWDWKTNASEKTIRCRIEIPANTQVVVDRSPSVNNDCEFKDGEMKSLFPDVLLPPGEFCIISIQRYRRPVVNDEKEEPGYTYLEPIDRYDHPLSPGRLLHDNEFAARALDYTSEFIDVRMHPVWMMELPETLDGTGEPTLDGPAGEFLVGNRRVRS